MLMNINPQNGVSKSAMVLFMIAVQWFILAPAGGAETPTNAPATANPS